MKNRPIHFSVAHSIHLVEKARAKDKAVEFLGYWLLTESTDQVTLLRLRRAIIAEIYLNDQ